MRKISRFALIFFVLTQLLVGCNEGMKRDDSLKDALQGKFYIGVAMNEQQILGKEEKAVELIKKHFNSIVAENCMKCELIHPVEKVYDFELTDQFVDFGEKNHMFIIGHTLIWHSQLAPWFTKDENGKDVSRELLIQRMKDHIHTIVGRYKGRVKGWDVVNEAIEDDGTLRKSKFYEIIGEDFIPMAFQFAHEADPDAELYYNDYSMHLPSKRNKVVEIVKSLQQKKLRIDGVGMQSHLNMDIPGFEDYEKSICKFIEAGVKVNITELDLSVLPWPDKQTGAEVSTNYAYQEKMNPYAKGLPANISVIWNDRMLHFFKLYNKYHKNMARVTLWGLTDGDSWKNDWPIEGRSDYPLLFDRQYQPKAIVDSILNMK